MRSARGDIVAGLLILAVLVTLFAAGRVWDRATPATTSTPSAPLTPTRPTTPTAIRPTTSATSTPPSATPSPTPWAIVLWVSDGDTIEVSLYGKATSVRLLNIDTPETKKAETAVECLGPEASASLKELLPRGTKVTLAYDWRRVDPFGRTLAAVRVGDRDLSTTQASRGFTAAIEVQGNDRYLAPVARAQASAIRDKRGLYDPAIACTKAGRVRATVTSLAVPATVPTSTTARANLATKLRAALSKAETLDAWLARAPDLLPVVDRSRYPVDYRGGLRAELAPAMAKARSVVVTLG